jgi:quercetin 2,3-dioxygenase
MRKLKQIVTAVRTSDGAGVSLYRSLGQSSHARVDPFLMLDEFGSDQPNEYIAGFPPHPHRGFETVTYMLEGHMLHEDHLGNKGHLKSGDVQWMTAGRGIIHSEMPQQEEGLMRGFQLWINLPAKEKMKPAAYQDIAAAELPIMDDPQGLRVKVIAGDLSRNGQAITGPIRGVSTEPIFFDVHCAAGLCFEEALPPEHNVYVYVYEGELVANPESSLTQGLKAKQGGVFSAGDTLCLCAGTAATKFLLLAAKPLNEPIVQHGPFVMNTRVEIEQAIADYRSNKLV